ncbi:e139c428-9a31-48af-97c8-f49d7830e21d [Sclerotinia trifoliorum]|uniref:E139c428-9a31-48af-97c8-f49d7830e21d n=1 Tax=Sclerotinia trifoliorum TaxID=28548 RepID=A0A8H2ZM68_9HELO|nr:e139c428-9a31-48af-97c8-f49d7830e21d [Sclerotinia trifoliorum]
MPSLIQHRRSMKHCPCLCCDPFDSQEELHEARQPSIDKYSCPECKQRFVQKPSLEAHQRESLHAYCYICDIVSPTRLLNALHVQLHSPVQVMTLSSATQFRCCECKRDFKNAVALTNHLRYNQVHALREGAENKNIQNQQDEGDWRTKCKKCQRTFKDWFALKQHMKSVRHKPLSDIKCLADAECKMHFNCPSAQLHHLEAGRCVSGITKTKLNAATAAIDTGRIITSGGVRMQWQLEDNTSETSISQIRSPILTPTSTEFLDSYPPSTIPTPTPTLSISASFHSKLTLLPRASHGYQTCPLCPLSSTRKFKHDALQQHLSSSIHNLSSLPLSVLHETSFHCPRIFMREGK